MSKFSDMLGCDPIADLEAILPKVTEIQPYRIKKMADKHDSYRIAAAIMAKEDEIQLSEMNVINGFLEGMREANLGIAHESGKGADYDRGYAAQYQLEAIIEGDK